MPLQAPSNYDTGTLHAHAGEATGDRSIHRTIVNEREVAARVGTGLRARPRNATINDGTYGLSEIREAISYLETGNAEGKVVIVSPVGVA